MVPVSLASALTTRHGSKLSRKNCVTASLRGLLPRAEAWLQASSHSGRVASTVQLCRNAARASVGLSLPQFGSIAQGARSRWPRAVSVAAMSGSNGRAHVSSMGVVADSVGTWHTAQTSHDRQSCSTGGGDAQAASNKTSNKFNAPVADFRTGEGHNVMSRMVVWLRWRFDDGMGVV